MGLVLVITMLAKSRMAFESSWTIMVVSALASMGMTLHCLPAPPSSVMKADGLFLANESHVFH
jgi:uncharacterized membrane protein YobD (UPF0266 family)